MAKQKTFNISEFVDEATKAAEPRRQVKSTLVPKTEETVGETSPYGYTQEHSQPIQPIQQIVAPLPEITQPKQRGRKKSLRTIPRENGKVVFLEVEADAAIARISVLQRVDKQDIIRTALDEFLKNHYDGRDLDAEGAKLITDYIIRTTKQEE